MRVVVRILGVIPRLLLLEHFWIFWWLHRSEIIIKNLVHEYLQTKLKIFKLHEKLEIYWETSFLVFAYSIAAYVGGLTNYVSADLQTQTSRISLMYSWNYYIETEISDQHSLGTLEATKYVFVIRYVQSGRTFCSS